jgi:hypothetical protein
MLANPGFDGPAGSQCNLFRCCLNSSVCFSEHVLVGELPNDGLVACL